MERWQELHEEAEKLAVLLAQRVEDQRKLREYDTKHPLVTFVGDSDLQFCHQLIILATAIYETVVEARYVQRNG